MEFNFNTIRKSTCEKRDKDKQTKAVYARGINKKRHIFVNLGKLQDETPLNSMQF